MCAQSAVCEAPAQVKKLDSVQTCASPVRVDLAFVVRRAVETQSHHKDAADAAGYEPDYWARVVKDERGIVLGRLGQLPVNVQRSIVIGWGAFLGLQVERKDSAQKRIALSKLAEAAQALSEIV